jgi:hypothetical protein
LASGLARSASDGLGDLKYCQLINAYLNSLKLDGTLTLVGAPQLRGPGHRARSLAISNGSNKKHNEKGLK